MEKMPKSGELYRHFENNLYQVITIAVHSETGEKLVIYQALYGDYQVFAEPLSTFLCKVDKEKYPDVDQKHRYEKVETGVEKPAETKEETVFADSEAVLEKESTAPCMEGGVDPKLMAFLDTDDLEEKYNILVSMRESITDHMINNLAVVLDVVIPEGDISDRYEELKNCIKTKQRYENFRLR